VIFASPIFLFWFLPVVLGVYCLLPMRTVPALDPIEPRTLAFLPRWLASKSGWLTLASFVFYGWWRPSYLPLMLFSALVDYYAGRALGRTESPGKRKALLVVSLATNLGLLAWFKYANFFVGTTATILGADAPAWVTTWEKVVLPVGISFYTFQSMSYTIDVYRRELAPIKNVGDFLCYVALFPQLVAGPIVRYADVERELQSRTHSTAKFATGTFLFMVGFAKKMLLADVVAPAANALFGVEAESGGAARAPLADPSTAEAWAGTIAYTFQIYFDFSGYSDMAAGLGLMLGFRFPVNFDSPYKSASVTEFWRRWHITLSTWLRDYLYVPLGGNRSGAARTYVNLSLTMLLGGLWHGASWTFVAWGAYQGFWLCVERALGRRTFYAALPRAVQIAATFVVVVFGWVLFRALTFEDAARVWRALVGLGGATGADGLLRLGFGADTMMTWGLVACAVATWGCRTSQEQARDPSWINALFVPLVFILAVAHLLSQSYSPFLYFRF
jgi:alginate O-acetyltransferase complex protein AlgI